MNNVPVDLRPPAQTEQEVSAVRLSRVQLPPELFCLIIEILPIIDLVPLLSVSCFFRSRAAPRFYREVTLIHGSIPCFANIIANIGHLVKSLELIHIHSSNEHIPHILKSTPNLDSLELSFNDGPPKYIPVYRDFNLFVPSDLPFKLRSLTVRYTFCPFLVEFLQSQRHSLSSLNLRIHPPNSALIEVVFPNLIILNTNCPTLYATAMQQGTVKCVAEASIAHTSYRAPTFSVRALTAFRLDYHTGIPDWLDIATRFPNIRFINLAMVSE